ncbi:hypothetical protein N7495_001619 [Penicillium taxi]|uniref:uncharacterized protein n=1 Tax=Penicillium taxi TaxID=168475 RepID=UPI002545384B|nr:uncharacterized protein N7495_001619 [Penicillium taxi]KAJ5908937.1 hypothetical protein N7495_001619 [Penicillium taxi]
MADSQLYESADKDNLEIRWSADLLFILFKQSRSFSSTSAWWVSWSQTLKARTREEEVLLTRPLLAHDDDEACGYVTLDLASLASPDLSRDLTTARGPSLARALACPLY